MHRLALALALWPLLAAAQHSPAPLRVCVDAVAYPPFTYPDRDGIGQLLVRRTAEALGIQVAFIAMPLKRCRAMLEKGEIDALNGASFVPEIRQIAQFPLQDERENPELAVVTVDWSVYRLVGSQANWDGQRFYHLNTPVLANAGVLAATQRLTELGQPFDAGAKNTADNLHKLLAGRAELTVQVEYVANAYIAREGLSGRIEHLPVPFMRRNYYFAYSKAYYASHRELAAAFWRELVVQRKSAAYQHAVRQLVDESAGPQH